MVPSGIIGAAFGPIEGRRHDNYVLYQSCLLEYLEEHCRSYYLYADGGYFISKYIVAPYRNINLTLKGRRLII
jgi:hypothetical protein